MATYSKLKFSGSTNGRMIKVGATTTPGTLIHTSITGSVDFDEIYIYACNTSVVDVNLTIEYGGTTAPDDTIPCSIPAGKGLVLLVPGFPLQGGCIVRAFASVTGVINVSGFVNRIAA